MLFKKGVPNNFAKFTTKHLCWGLFLISFRPPVCNIIKKRDSNTGVFM